MGMDPEDLTEQFQKRSVSPDLPAWYRGMAKDDKG